MIAFRGPFFGGLSTRPKSVYNQDHQRSIKECFQNEATGAKMKEKIRSKEMKGRI